jgi:hypothetical protein
MRTPGRIPGFTGAPAAQPTAPASQPTTGEGRPSVAPPAYDRRAGRHQLNVRVVAPLLDRYRRLTRDLKDEGFETSIAELLHALLHAGPSTTAEARTAVRAWRRALDPDD